MENLKRDSMRDSMSHQTVKFISGYDLSFAGQTPGVGLGWNFKITNQEKILQICLS